ncbi:unnamed protein product, partial [Ectocarpus sp. 8 AP-2014]
CCFAVLGEDVWCILRRGLDPRVSAATTIEVLIVADDVGPFSVEPYPFAWFRRWEGNGSSAASACFRPFASGTYKMDVVVALMAQTVFVFHSTSPCSRWSFFLTALQEADCLLFAHGCLVSSGVASCCRPGKFGDVLSGKNVCFVFSSWLMIELLCCLSLNRR